MRTIAPTETTVGCHQGTVMGAVSLTCWMPKTSMHPPRINRSRSFEIISTPATAPISTYSAKSRGGSGQMRSDSELLKIATKPITRRA